MGEELDDDGQPSEAFNWNRRLDRGMDELIGLARGVLADGILVVEEARFMLNWLERNEPVRRDFFGRRLHGALTRALADGEVNADEEDELIDLLLRFSGGTPVTDIAASHSTTLPLDDPPPAITLPGYSFCLTGKFMYGTRRNCESAVVERGGLIHKYPTCATGFLVIGQLGSRDWIHSSSGRKIERAIEIRQQGHPLKLIHENHWQACLS